jgi:hypothetical protein
MVILRRAIANKVPVPVDPTDDDGEQYAQADGSDEAADDRPTDHGDGDGDPSTDPDSGGTT